MTMDVKTIERKLMYFNDKLHNVQYIFKDFNQFFQINENFMVLNKINLEHYLYQLKKTIISEKSFPLINIHRFEKTFKDLIEKYFSPIYKLLITPQIIMSIGKTILHYYLISGVNYRLETKTIKNHILTILNVYHYYYQIPIYYLSILAISYLNMWINPILFIIG